MTLGLNSKKLLWATGIMAIVLAFSTVYLVHHYGETRPTAMQVQTGRIHSAKIHERTVYLTGGEYALVFATHVIAIAAIGVFIGVALRSRFKGHTVTPDP
jgi:hypothetical protein